MVDSFKYLPRLIALFYQSQVVETPPSIPWTPFTLPLAQAKIALVTSAGIYHRPTQPPFDLQRELEQPAWGDPSFREIASDTPPEELGISHLHINPEPILKDINVVLPLQRMAELAEAGVIGGLAPTCYSFMGYQGFPPEPRRWQEEYAPQVAQALKSEGVQGVLLTPV